MFNLIEYIKHKSVNLVGASTVKLNANAQEFVPQLKMPEVTTDGGGLDFQTINQETEALEERKPKCKLTLPWKGFPRKPDKVPGGTQIVLLNDLDYMIKPRVKSAKRSKDEALVAGNEMPSVPNGEKPSKENVPILSPAEKILDMEEKRRERERKVALEALKLVEQRRLRGALLPTAQNCENPEAPAPQPIVHLSRSPVRYTPEERTKVDRLRVAKKERIERVLRDMHNEKVEQEKLKNWQLLKFPPNAPTENKSVVAPSTRRYIPTTKEWDEQCRAKQQTSSKLNPVKIEATEVVKREEPKSTDIPRYRPPSQLLNGEKRKGNLTHWLPPPNWTPRRLQQTLVPLKNRKGIEVKRYTIEQLLQLEPQPEELEKPDFADGLGRLYILTIPLGK